MVSLEKIQGSIRLKRVEFQKHALKRILDENLTIDSVLEVILTGEIIKEYIDDKPYPSVLILGFCGKRPIHVVCAYNQSENKIHIVTNYEVKPEYYEPDFKTRRNIK